MARFGYNIPNEFSELRRKVEEKHKVKYIKIYRNALIEYFGDYAVFVMEDEKKNPSDCFTTCATALYERNHTTVIGLERLMRFAISANEWGIRIDVEAVNMNLLEVVFYRDDEELVRGDINNSCFEDMFMEFQARIKVLQEAKVA